MSTAGHKALVTVAALGLVLVGFAGGDGDPSSEREPTAAGAAGPDTPSDRGQAEGKAEDEVVADASGGARSMTTPRPSAPKPQRKFYVARIIDGDTIELGNGETVRLVGIDTPEVGECGYLAANAALSQLILGEMVRLTISDEDRDGYGRLLRYVDLGGTDAGLRLIKRGLAIARYDSRDGYGYHPREPQYVANDRGTKNFCPMAPGPPDLNCPDVGGPIRVTGADPHGLDADNDGIACES